MEAGTGKARMGIQLNWRGDEFVKTWPAQPGWTAALASLCAGSLFFALSACGEEVARSDFLEVTPPLSNVGDLWPGQRTEVEVQLKNVHPAASLAITKMETDCGCSVSSLEVRILNPGEATTATVAMNFGSAVGERDTVAVFGWRLDGDEGTNGTAAVRLRGNVVDLVVLPSVAISLGTIDKRAGEFSGEFRIAAGSSGERIGALEVRSPLGGFRAEGSADGDGGFLVKFYLDPAGLPAGSFHEPVDLVFFDAEHERGARRMFVSGSVRGGVQVSPPSVVIHDAKRGESIKQVLRITSEHGDGPVRLSGDVVAKRGFVEVSEISQAREALELELTLMLPKDADPVDGVNAEIVIPVACEEGEESLKVSVVAFFLAP